MTASTTVSILRVGRRARISPEVAPKASKIGRCGSKCSTCNLRELCQPCCGLTRSERDVAGRLQFYSSRLRRGETLYRVGDRFTCLYAVRDGFFKSVAPLENGRDQVTGFSMTGDVVGMDGIGSERHACKAIALEDGEVCVIPFAGLQELTREIPSLQRDLNKLMSRQIARGNGMILQLGAMTAKERLAMFLLDLSRRFAARGHSSSEFHLPMSRCEIGSYLGLTLETVSRMFSGFEENKLIGVQRKSIHILDGAGLERLMGRKPDGRRARAARGD